MKVKLSRVTTAPKRAHAEDAGLDIYSAEHKFVPANGSAIFHTGVHVQIPRGCAGILISKSGLNVNADLTSTGLIDEGYTGEIVVKLYNHGKKDFFVNFGDKISQLVVIPVQFVDVEIVDEIEGGERGDAGFGSTDRE